MESMKRRRKYDTIGKCIYCGDSKSPHSLTLEHIIPEALGGGLMFKRASCGACQKAIGSVEGRLSNKLFASARALLELRTSSATPRKKLRIQRALDAIGSKFQTVWTDKAAHPGVIILERLMPPRFVKDREPDPRGRQIKLLLKNLTGDPTKATGHMETYIPSATYEDFTRQLAKIAHSYWVAERGWPADFHPHLTDFILGKSEFEHDYFIGSSEAINHRIDDLHHVALGTEQRGDFTYPYVDIALFACFPPYNSYRVYVGSLGKKMSFRFIERPNSN